MEQRMPAGAEWPDPAWSITPCHSGVRALSRCGVLSWLPPPPFSSSIHIPLALHKSQINSFPETAVTKGIHHGPFPGGVFTQWLVDEEAIIACPLTPSLGQLFRALLVPELCMVHAETCVRTTQQLYFPYPTLFTPTGVSPMETFQQLSSMCITSSVSASLGTQSVAGTKSLYFWTDWKFMCLVCLTETIQVKSSEL